MDIHVIDWSKGIPELYQEVEKYRKSVILSNISRIDEILRQLREEDIFNHVEFRKVRPRLGSQKEWADLVGVSQATIGNYERSVTYPNKQTRTSIARVLDGFRAQEANKLSNRNGVIPKVNVDPIAAKKALDESILDASLTDFAFDADEQKVIAVPFRSDVKQTEIEEIEKDRTDLFESLRDQAKNISVSLKSGANANIGRLVDALDDYALETQRDRANPRKLFRWGSNISRAASNDDITFAISDWDREALDGFVDDHQELMRLYYREALAKAQQVDAAFVPDDAELPSGDEFSHIADIIDTSVDEDGEKVFSEDISTLLRDISREITEYQEAEILTSDPERKKIIRRRRIESVKNGSILVGRFLFFTSFFLAVDPMVALSVAGSIASLIGVVEQKSPGTIRKYYEKLRQAMPFLPRFPGTK